MLTAEQKLIAENHRRFVWSIALKFQRTAERLNIDIEDVVSEGMIGLLKAIPRFEPERGFAFTTYAGSRIEGQIKLFFRDRGHLIRMPRSDRNTTNQRPFIHRSLQDVVRVASDGDKLHLEDMIPINDDLTAVEVRDYIKRLPERDQRIIHLHIYEGKTQAEIGQMLGVSQVQVSRLLAKIKQKLLSEFYV